MIEFLLLQFNVILVPKSVVDPDLELTGWGGGRFLLLALAAFLPFVISSVLPKITGALGPRVRPLDLPPQKLDLSFIDRAFVL